MSPISITGEIDIGSNYILDLDFGYTMGDAVPLRRISSRHFSAKERGPGEQGDR